MGIESDIDEIKKSIIERDYNDNPIDNYINLAKGALYKISFELEDGNYVLWYPSHDSIKKKLELVNLFLATLHGMWDLSSLTGDRTHAYCSASAES